MWIPCLLIFLSQLNLLSRATSGPSLCCGWSFLTCSRALQAPAIPSPVSSPGLALWGPACLPACWHVPPPLHLPVIHWSKEWQRMVFSAPSSAAALVTDPGLVSHCEAVLAAVRCCKPQCPRLVCGGVSLFQGCVHKLLSSGVRPAVLGKHLILVRPSFFTIGLNFHRFPQSSIQLDLKLFSPQRMSLKVLLPLQWLE